MTAPIHRFDSVDSTQHLAKELAAQGCEHGTMVLARRQTAGRGRQARTWLSVEEALLCSVVLRPMVPVRLAPRLPLVVCARLLSALDAMVTTPLSCKWPNDLMLAAPTDAPRLGPYRKVGGVLVEAIDVSDVLGCCVVGIGINVRGALPAEIAEIAGTLVDAGFTQDVEALAARVHEVLPSVPSGMSDGGFAAVRDVLSARSATLGRRVELDDVRGLAEAIDADGGLVVRKDDGARITVRAGDAWIAQAP
jgi:BirA family transcriptional regulator, biotin operon repressor / biotin---[acetyl-CoA-carboxylase] ligase